MYSGLVWGTVASRLKALSTTECSEMTAEMLVKVGLCDPIRVFVKNEPHSVTKLTDGRYRLIMSVSIVDQLVERVLCSEQNGLEIADYDRLPVKPGMGFSDDKVDAMGSYFDSFKTLVSSDVSGWDWSVSGDELRFDALRRISASGVPMDSAYAKALLARATCLGRSVIAFSDGSLVAQRRDGVQKSGSYNTSSGNSWIRVAAARYAGAARVAAMGDDCVDDGTNPMIMASLGHGLKDSVVVSSSLPSWQEDVALYPTELRRDVCFWLNCSAWEPYDPESVPVADFCSHWWLRTKDQGWAIAYRSWHKSLFRLAHVKNDKYSHFLEFVGLMAHSPAMPHCVEMLLDEGWFIDCHVT